MRFFKLILLLYLIKLNKIYLYLIFTLSILYILYRLMISFYAIKHWVHNLRTGKFIVRNFP